MKKFTTSLVLALLLMITNTNAQFSIGAGVGFSTLGSAVAQLPMAVETKWVNIQAGFYTHLTMDADKGALFYTQLGKTLHVSEDVEIIPAVGYAYDHISGDDPSLNTDGLISSLYAYAAIDDDISLFAGGAFVFKREYVLMTIGARYKIQRNDKVVGYNTYKPRKNSCGF